MSRPLVAGVDAVVLSVADLERAVAMWSGPLGTA